MKYVRRFTPLAVTALFSNVLKPAFSLPQSKSRMDYIQPQQIDAQYSPRNIDDARSSPLKDDRQSILDKRRALYFAANELKTTGNYMQAIVNLEKILKITLPLEPNAIDSMNYEVIKHNLQIRILIADCYYLNKNFEMAYQELTILHDVLNMQHLNSDDREFFTQTISARLSVYRIEIEKLAQFKIAIAKKYCESKPDMALHFLSQAAELFQVMKVNVPQELSDLKNRANWFYVRSKNMSDAAVLLDHVIIPKNVNKWVIRLQDVIRNITNHSDILNSHDEAIFKEVKEKLETALNIQRMELVGEELQKYEMAIDDHNWLEALAAIKVILQLELSITNQDDINISDVEFIQPEALSKALEIIAVYAQEDIDCAKKHIPNAIDKIFVVALRNLGHGSVIYDVQLQFLKTEISNILRNNWHKFKTNERYPEALLDKIGERIEMALYPSHSITRSWYWTSADLFVDKQEELLVDISDLVINEISTDKNTANLSNLEKQLEFYHQLIM